MATDKESMAYARECVRLAGLTDEPEIRDQLFALAREWMAAAIPRREPRRGRAYIGPQRVRSAHTPW
jgi:hypothetical protein